MRWCVISKEYIEYLKEVDKRVPNIDYGENSFKPFFSPLFEKDGLVYVAQISSRKEKHIGMKNRIDFIKITYKNEFYGVVNLNYMFPVPKSEIQDVDYREIENYRKFKSTKEKIDYIVLLKKELSRIRYIKVNVLAEKLYLEVENKVFIKKRCLNFHLLEEKAKEFEKIKENTQEISSKSEAVDIQEKSTDINGQFVRYNKRRHFYMDWDNKEEVLLYLKQNGMRLEFATKKIKNDREAVLTACESNGLALAFSSFRLQNNQEVVTKAINNNISALKYAGDKIKDNKEFILKAIEHDNKAFIYSSENLKEDKDVILAAIKKDKELYKYASITITAKYPTVEKFIEIIKENSKSKEVPKERSTRSRIRSKGQER